MLFDLKLKILPSSGINYFRAVKSNTISVYRNDDFQNDERANSIDSDVQR